MKSFIRSFKWSYAIYNFFNKKKLQHNIPLYKKYGINKTYFSPVSSTDFKEIKEQFLRKEDNIALQQTDFYQKQSEENKKNLEAFFDEGFAVIKGFLSEDEVNKINQDVEYLLATQQVQFKYRNKLMFLLHKSENIKKIGERKDILQLLDVLMDGKAKLFQSINFISGSEQKTHSDSVHMTTFPLGGLVGVWIALEDIDETNGALHYYPKSHRLPYYLNSDYDNEGNFWFLGNRGYGAYEEMLAQKVKELQLKKTIFKAKKGDMLIWHANILHGGEPHLDRSKTRKSMVFHYFDEQSICYHEITQRPALFTL